MASLLSSKLRSIIFRSYVKLAERSYVFSIRNLAVTVCEGWELNWYRILH